MSMAIGADRRGQSVTRYGVLAAVVFGLFFAYARLRLDPCLIYHQQQPMFRVGWSFFAEHLVRPGGAVEYVAALLCQWCSFSSAGAAVLTLLAAAICLATAAYMAGMGGWRLGVASFVPAVLLLMLHNRYDHPLTTDVGLLVTLVFTVIYLYGPRAGVAVRLPVFVMLSVILYVAAAGPFLLFAVLCALHEVLARKRVGLAAAGILCGLALPYVVGVLIWRVDLLDAYARLLPFHPAVGASAASVALYVLFPVLGLGAWRWRRRARASADEAPSDKSGDRREHGRWLAQAAALLVVGGGLVGFTFDRQAQALLRIDYCAAHGIWEPIPGEAARLPAGRYALTTHWDVNRALFHTGRLPYDMFRYPQVPAGLLRDNSEPEIMKLPEAARMHLGGLFLELGRMAEAEHVTQESLENLGEYPSVIQRLALIYLVKQEPDAARVFLNALSKHLLYRGWAKSYLERMRQDSLMSEDEQIRHLRSVMILIDHLGQVPIETMLQQLLDRDSQNRMAFEYLMAYYLLTRQVGGVAREIGRLGDFDYEGIPPYYEEAILLHMKATLNVNVDLHGREIRQEARDRLKAFFDALKEYQRDQRAAREALAGTYGDTYLYYHTFGTTGRSRAMAWVGEAR